MIANVYLPVDTNYDRNNLAEYNDALSNVSSVARDNGIDHVIFAGDFNTDMSRRGSLHILLLSSNTLLMNLYLNLKIR